MRIVETVRELVIDTVEKLGYRLYDIDFLKEVEGYVLIIYIDADAPITLDDCEKVSRAVEPILDEKDPITQAYYLSVSSVGLDRPLKIDEDYKRNLGKAVDVKLYAPLESEDGLTNEESRKKNNKKKKNKKDNSKQLTGILESYDEESFTVSLEKTGEHITISKRNAAMIKPHIDF